MNKYIFVWIIWVSIYIKTLEVQLRTAPLKWASHTACVLGLKHSVQVAALDTEAAVDSAVLINLRLSAGHLQRTF